MFLFATNLLFASPESPYEEGIVQMTNKNFSGAITAFEQCINEKPEQIECHWEIGWAHWMLSDWNAVVKHWSIVESKQPEFPKLSGYLTQAKDNQTLQQIMADSQKSAPATFASAVTEGSTLRIRSVGDMMIGTNFPAGYLPKNDGADSFTNIKSELQDADITFGNLEGPLCDGMTPSQKCVNSAPGKCYAFRSPASYAPYYKDAGFDLLSTANNHANDFGSSCRLETETLLDEQGIAHSGRPGDIASIEVNGFKVSMIAFYTNRSSHYLNDHDTAKKLVASQASTHDIVIVSFHGGAEGSKAIHVPKGSETFYGENRGDLRTFTHDVIDAGADLVIGHGPHVLRGMEIYKNKLIAYSLGNFATYGRFNISGYAGMGVILETTIDANGDFVAGEIISTKQIGRGVPTLDEDNKAIDLIRTLSTDDFGKTAVKIAVDGQIRP
jgi:poly-gamma-glutamate capsule biosynthesis protein CapA/YwtB (metallophosphatase superfamily)